MSVHVYVITRMWRHIPENNNFSYTSNHHVYTGNVTLQTKGYHLLVCSFVYQEPSFFVVMMKGGSWCK